MPLTFGFFRQLLYHATDIWFVPTATCLTKVSSPQQCPLTSPLSVMKGRVRSAKLSSTSKLLNLHQPPNQHHLNYLIATLVIIIVMFTITIANTFTIINTITSPIITFSCWWTWVRACTVLASSLASFSLVSSQIGDNIIGTIFLRFGQKKC